MVPAIVHILNKSSLHVAESLSSLRYVGISGAPIDGYSMQQFQRLLSPDAVAGNLWGMSEVGVVFQNRYGVTPQFGSVGTLLPGYELRFVDPDTGEDVGGTSDSPGELYVRGPGLLLGYKGRTDGKDEQGWFRTGDMVHARDGNYYVTGRTKDLIKVRAQVTQFSKLSSFLFLFLVLFLDFLLVLVSPP
jgi:acyl-CoA synthetase (AMP-forming)/AMP-acid ligase II